MPKDEDRTAQEWRELLRTSYDYPEETKEGRRKERRRARRAHRRSEREHTAEWIRQRRRREPITIGGAALVVAALLALGACARFGPDWIKGGSSSTGASRVTAAPDPVKRTGDDAKPSGPAPAPTSASPSTAVDLSVPDKVAEAFVRQYLTRNPPKDQTHRAAVDRAAPWATRSLTANLEANTDPAFDKLVSRGGVSKVSAVTVAPAGGTLPPDSPLRVWRTVTATVDVQGYTNSTETTVIQAEVTHTESGWRVSGILGV
ncbi:hypothetical protein ACWC5F_30475 [Streptomyces sp. NPDC001272]